MTLFHQTGEETIRAKHTIVLNFSASRAVTERLETVQELRIRARPASGACCSASVLGRVSLLFPSPGREDSGGDGETGALRYLPGAGGNWCSPGLRRFMLWSRETSFSKKPKL